MHGGPAEAGGQTTYTVLVFVECTSVGVKIVGGCSSLASLVRVVLLHVITHVARVGWSALRRDCHVSEP